MIDSKPLITNCSIHASKKLICICPVIDCESRLLCLDCAKNHSSDHEPHFISLLEAVNFDLDAELQQTKKIFEEKQILAEKDTKLVQDFFNDFKTHINQVIDNARDKYLMKLPSYKEEDFESLEKEFGRLKQQMQNKDGGPEKLMKLVEYLVKFSDLKVRANQDHEELPNELKNKQKIDEFGFSNWLNRKLAFFDKPLVQSWKIYDAQHAQLGGAKKNILISKESSLYCGAITSELLPGNRYTWKAIFRDTKPVEDAIGFAILGIIPVKKYSTEAYCIWSKCINLADNGLVLHENDHLIPECNDNFFLNKPVKFELDLVKGIFKIIFEDKEYFTCEVQIESYYIIGSFEKTSTKSIELL